MIPLEQQWRLLQGCPHLLHCGHRHPAWHSFDRRQHLSKRSPSPSQSSGQACGLAARCRRQLVAAATAGTSSPSASSISLQVGGQEVVLESGEIGRQANGAVMLRTGGTVLYTTVCMGEASGDGSFTPLTVVYSERFSAAGKISGGWLKREGRPKEADILTSRLVDRPLRPMMPKGFANETQVVSYALSYDGIHPPEPHAITAGSAALLLSDVPFTQAVAGVRVGLTEAEGIVVNPTTAQMAASRLDLVLAGTHERLLMVEGFCDFLSDEQMQQAVHAGMAEVSQVCKALEAWAESIGKPPAEWRPVSPEPFPIETAAQAYIVEELGKVYSQGLSKHERGAAVEGVRQAAREQLLEQGHTSVSVEDSDTASSASDSTTASTSGRDEEAEKLMGRFSSSFRTLHNGVVRDMAMEGRRADGREASEVRPITSRAGLLPCTHGSALFTRGETQSLAVATLGPASGAQMVDNMQTSQEAQRFQLQYFFPQSSVGETGRTGFASRREIGHGHLAERSVSPVIPGMEDFPYAVRIESTITESNGSSSMASVCSACLALRDAGVPISRNVAGVAMGLVLREGDDFTILTDILGSEDACGDMDFKVAGDESGITAFQLDVKAAGIPVAVLDQALPAARAARAHVLQKMAECSPTPRGELGSHVPRILRMTVPIAKLGLVIGPGGRTVRSIYDRTGCTSIEIIDQDAGRLEIVGPSATAVDQARDIISTLTEDPEEGTVYSNVAVTGVEKFGLFVEFMPSLQGLVHVSELSKPLGDHSVGDIVDVKLLEVNDGKFRLSIKALNPEASNGAGPAAEPPAPPPQEGDILRGVVVKNLTSYGAFVEITPGQQALVHVSQLAAGRINDPAEHFSIGDTMDVQVLAPRKDGKLSLSRKALLAASTA